MDNENTKCYECVYLGEKDGVFFCNFGDSERYGDAVDSKSECEFGERE